MSCWRHLRGLAVPVCVLGAMLLAGCWRGPAPSPEESGELVVATRNSPTTYFLDAEVADTLEELFDSVASGRAHLAAAGITATEERRARVRFGPNYGQVKEWVVCRQGLSAPAAVKDLVGLRLEVVAGSSHVERLRFHRRRLPELRWTEMELPGPEELMERLDVGLGDCAVVDSDSLDVGRNFHPGLRPAFVLESAQPQAWVLGRGVDLRLSRRVVDFFKKLEAGGDLVRLRERYFGHVTRLAEVDVLGVLDKRATLLNELRPHFHDAQAETGLDWRLLAAIGYQESQWDAHAQSPTGVRGLMMLTRQTADHLGVKDRLDARESILGGARYVVELKAALPDTVPEPDRTWIALAAYNIGMGHLNDARTLARRLGKNPDQWRAAPSMPPVCAMASRAAARRAPSPRTCASITTSCASTRNPTAACWSSTSPRRPGAGQSRAMRSSPPM